MAIQKSNGAVAERPADAAEAAAPVARRELETGTNGRDDRKVSNFEDAKSRRILVQGITQAVAASPSVAGLGYTTEDEIVAHIKSVAKKLIAFVDEESK